MIGMKSTHTSAPRRRKRISARRRRAALSCRFRRLQYLPSSIVPWLRSLRVDGLKTHDARRADFLPGSANSNSTGHFGYFPVFLKINDFTSG